MGKIFFSNCGVTIHSDWEFADLLRQAEGPASEIVKRHHGKGFCSDLEASDRRFIRRLFMAALVGLVVFFGATDFLGERLRETDEAGVVRARAADIESAVPYGMEKGAVGHER